MSARFVEAALVAAGYDPGDRESNPFYRTHILPLEYDSLLDVAGDNLRIGRSVVLDAPFSPYLSDPDFITRVRAPVRLAARRRRSGSRSRLTRHAAAPPARAWPGTGSLEARPLGRVLVRTRCTTVLVDQRASDGIVERRRRQRVCVRSILDLREVPHFLWRRRTKSQELQVRRDLFEQHVHADLGLTTAIPSGPQKGGHRRLHHHLAHERGRRRAGSCQLAVDRPRSCRAASHSRRGRNRSERQTRSARSNREKARQSTAERFSGLGHCIDQTHPLHPRSRQRRRDRRPDPAGTDDQRAGAIQCVPCGERP